MSVSQTTTKISTDDLREEVRKEYADVVISNGVLNLTPDKVKTIVSI